MSIQDAVVGTGVVEEEPAVKSAATFYEQLLRILSSVKILSHVLKGTHNAAALEHSR